MTLVGSFDLGPGEVFFSFLFRLMTWVVKFAQRVKPAFSAEPAGTWGGSAVSGSVTIVFDSLLTDI